MTAPRKQSVADQPPVGGSQPRTPAVAVLVVILTVDEGELKVLLIHRSAEPFKDYWAVPGGLLALGESLDSAAARKLVEETGVSDVFLEQLYTFSDLDGQGTVAVTYFALVHRESAQLATRRVWPPAWFAISRLPTLAFRNDEVIAYAVRRLRSKLSYSNVAYSLLPREFTLSQLQAVYECILGRRLDKRNFRKRMLSLGIIASTGRSRTEGAHRPAQLYTFSERRPVIL